MKRFFTAIAFCSFLLAAGSFIIVRRSEATAQAKEDIVAAMLTLPAPPPPNPWMRNALGDRKFDKNNPPGDDAPIEELMAYWRAQSSGYRDLGHNILPSGRSLERIIAELEKDPKSVIEYINILRDSSRGAEFAKRVYDTWPDGDEERSYLRDQLKKWLVLNSPYFTGQLAKIASQAADTNQYVTNQRELLALSQYDWEEARPMVDRMYRDTGQPVSRVLAMWALYKHAMDEDAIGDTDRYRDELKAVVEDKKATHGMRDLAFDALVKEKEWGGRDDWYFSLLEDETLADLRVNGTSYTGLTTIVMYSPPEKYADKMIELVKSKNPVLRNAAARNLGIILDRERPDVVRALLPWLEDPKWATDISGTRQRLVTVLQTLKMPESVPGLIAMLDEKQTQELRIPTGSSNSNANAAMWSAANRAVNAAATVANAAANAVIVTEDYELRSAANTVVNVRTTAANSGSYRSVNVATTPYRGPAIQALGMQGDMRAAPALRRLIPEMDGYELQTLVKALFQVRGFTVAEQVDALESAIRELHEAQTGSNVNSMDVDTRIRYGYANTVSNMPVRSGPADQATLKSILGNLVLLEEEVSEELVRAVIDRIAAVDSRDPKLAASLRSVLLNWKGPAINALLLSDLKLGKSSTDAVVKLLAIRKELREKQPNDVYALRTGVPAAVGIAACLLEDESDYAGILAGENTETKTAMLACARLIRGKLPIQPVAANLRSPNKRLALAAESYLESEDSPEARAIVLSLHPNEAKILGATTSFRPVGTTIGDSRHLMSLFASVHNYFAVRPDYGPISDGADFSGIERRLQKEVIDNVALLGVYSYGGDFIRIYKDKAIFSWEEDESRYRERTLAPEEFEHFKGFLAHHRVDELTPFLASNEGEYEQEWEARELLMLAKQGGRRVFVSSSRKPPFFAELEGLFANMRLPGAKLHYWLEKDVPGLEILFADDNLSAVTVWKSGSDFRLLVEDKPRRKAIDREIADTAETMSEPEDGDLSGAESKIDEMRQKRAYENYTWFNFGQGGLGAPAVQPEQAEFIPVRDAFSPPSVVGRWKSRAAGVEIRADSEGLYKIAGGRVTKIGSGNYDSPVVTPNGRWAIATKYSDENGPGLVRVNLSTNKEFPVTFGEEPISRAIAFVPGINRMLVTVYEERDNHEEGYGGESALQFGYWLDPETGAVKPASGELSPLAHQTFRSLQPAANAFEFWVATPDSERSETVIGVYNTRNFTLTPRLKLPKINFDSMDMWADETQGKLYFVYEGHLLAVPFK